MKIFRRPMFRKGGEAMTGIMENVQPRQNYKLGMDVKEEDISDFISLVRGGQEKADPLTDFLLQFGPNLLAQRPVGSGVSGMLATAGAAAKDPLADLVKQKRTEKSEDLALRAKAIETLGVDDLRKFRNYAKAMLPEGASEADVDAQIKKLLESQFAEKSPFLKADSPAEKIDEYANFLIKDKNYPNTIVAGRRATFEKQDYSKLQNAGVNIKLDRAKKIKNKKGQLKRNVEPGVYFDDLTGTYTRVGMSGDTPVIEEEKISLEALIGG
jgi:hypothetical protein